MVMMYVMCCAWVYVESPWSSPFFIFLSFLPFLLSFSSFISFPCIRVLLVYMYTSPGYMCMLSAQRVVKKPFILTNERAACHNLTCRSPTITQNRPTIEQRSILDGQWYFIVIRGKAILCGIRCNNSNSRWWHSNYSVRTRFSYLPPSVGTMTCNADSSVPRQVNRRGSVGHTPLPSVHLVSLKLASKDGAASGNWDTLHGYTCIYTYNTVPGQASFATYYIQ